METLQRDPYLWQKAKARAKFQSHFMSYLFVNATLWVIWAFSLSHRGYHSFYSEIPWPLWVSFFWGIGLLKRGIAAYGGGGLTHEQRAQREYERLVQEHRPTPAIDPLDKYR